MIAVVLADAFYARIGGAKSILNSVIKKVPIGFQGLHKFFVRSAYILQISLLALAFILALKLSRA